MRFQVKLKQVDSPSESSPDSSSTGVAPQRDLTGQLRAHLSRIIRLQQKGDFLQAFDLSMRVHRRFPESLAAKFHAVSALAHCGYIEKAWALYGPETWDLDKVDPADLAALAGSLSYYRAKREERDRRRAKEPASSISSAARAGALYPLAYEHIASSSGFLAREQAWNAPPNDRARFARQAAEQFVKVYEATDGVMSGVNAAAMYYLAGDPNSAKFMVKRVLAASPTAANGPPSSCDILIARALNAFMRCDLGEFAATMRQILEVSANRPLWETGTVWRQIEIVYRHYTTHLKESVAKDPKQRTQARDELKKRRTLFAAFRPPSIVHYGGHMISVPGAENRFHDEEAPSIMKKIRNYLAQHNVGAGYGSLACGADILFAEALIKRNAELHVVIPFHKEEFIDTSVRRGGKLWLERFEQCYKRATSVTLVTDDEYLGDPDLFALGSNVAMGMARWRHFATTLPLRQILVWDKETFPGRAGTAWMRNRWTEDLKLPGADYIVCGTKVDAPARSNCIPPPQGTNREVKVLLFGDVKGFSKLNEELVPKFWEVVIGGLTETLETFHLKSKAVSYWNTWGDAVFVVIDSVKDGAECALRLQERIKRTNFAAAGLPPEMTMRFGMHVGAVYRSRDPVTKAKTWYGSQVSRAARIEPVASPGEIYVSEPFAHVLALEAHEKYECEYVGIQQAAKAYGAFRMYRLLRRQPASTSQDDETAQSPNTAAP